MARSFINFSGLLVRSMYQFAQTANEIERQLDPRRESESTTLVLGAITTSVAFLESLINEVFILAGVEGSLPYQRLDASSRRAMANLWDDVACRLPILAKYDLVLALNDSEGFDHGATPYQDAEVLIQLRNAIVHYRTGFRLHPDPEPLKLEKRLKGKFPECAYYKSHRCAFFPSKCLGAGCAVWAVKSARAYADDFHRKLHVVGLYQQLQGIPCLV